MSTQSLDHPLSNVLNKSSEVLNFFVKIENKLVPITLKHNHTVRNLKMLLEEKLKIPSISYFLIIKRLVMKDSDKIGKIIAENSIILLNFKQLGGMIDAPFSAPLHGLEVILLDQENRPISGTLLETSSNPKNLPTNLVCRIYTNIGCGTGFGIRTARGEILIVTAKHVISSQFGRATLIAACFELDQHIIGKIIIEDFYNGRHQCRPSIQELNVVDFDFSGYDCLQVPQKDLITGEFYSIHDDIVALRPTGKCICGVLNQIPPIGHLNFLPTPDSGSTILLLGYPGIFTEKTKVFSLDVSEIEFNSVKTSFYSDSAMYTEGVILNRGIISCISASSVGGMSGSPMLYCDQGEWKISGMLVGGPAVYGHRKLLNILGAFYDGDRNACEILINELENPLVKRSRVMAISLLDNYDILPELVHDMYFREIKLESLELQKKFLNPKDILNHNLVYDCFRFIDQVVNTL